MLRLINLLLVDWCPFYVSTRYILLLLLLLLLLLFESIDFHHLDARGVFRLSARPFDDAFDQEPQPVWMEHIDGVVHI